MTLVVLCVVDTDDNEEEAGTGDATVAEDTGAVLSCIPPDLAGCGA
jgi:hypothetical protein